MLMATKLNKNKEASFSPCGLFFCFCLLFSLALTGCASKQNENAYYENYDNNAYVNEHVESVAHTEQEVKVHKLRHASGLDYDDLDDTDLTEKQKEILLKTSELEKGLSKAQMLDVLEFYEYFLEKEEMLEVFLGRSLPYSDYLTQIFVDRGLPQDISYLAFIESGYNIKAKSSAGATGLWQFMPATGRHYGLKQDWWGDWRHDPYQSTHAAAEYLTDLYNRFGDWLLAISAYNAGQGKINKALRGTGTDNLGDLVQSNGMLSRSDRLRKETLEYVPRLLAMAKIMNHKEELGIEAQVQKNTQPSAKIHSTLVKNNTDLLALSKELKMSWNEFHLYNPALKSYVSPGDRFVYVHIPESKAHLMSQALAKTSKSHGYYAYKVRRNDSFSRISQASKVPVSVLQHINPVRVLKVNSIVYIPQQHGKALPKAITSPAPVSPTKAVAKNVKANAASKNQSTLPSTPIHRVSNGDTYYGIADRYNIEIKDLYALNKNVDADTLSLGTILRLPKNTKSAAMASEYIVKKGDTLWDISRNENVSSSKIKEYNNLSNSSFLKVGQVLILPNAQSETLASNQSASQRVKSVATRTSTALASVIEDAFIDEYVVQAGDTLWDISREIEVSTETIMELNNLKSASSIKAGQVLKLPQTIAPVSEQVALNTPQEYVVQSGDTLWGISRKINVSTSEIMELNNLSDAAAIKAGQKLRLQ